MTVIKVDPQAVRLKRRLRAHFKSLGFTRGNDGSLCPPDHSKDTYRLLHLAQRKDKLKRNKEFIKTAVPKLAKYFADGKDVTVAKITPHLELVQSDTWQSDLFRLAALSWQIPVSEGYGRRLRFLVWDKNAKKLMGIIALGDAVFNLRVRDEYIGWDHRDRAKRMVNVMDAYVLGAIPPYNQLLGGKLVSCLIRTKQVAAAFKKKYRRSVGVISHKRKKPVLALVTTSSALGRSSVYNRLRLNDTQYFTSLGYTGGWGHFHISDALFDEIRLYLKAQHDDYAANNLFGDGPNWRLRAIRKAFHLLGMNQELVRHQLTREVFVCELAKNATQFLNGTKPQARFGKLLSVKEVGEQAVARWMIPRAERYPDWVEWRAEDFLQELSGTKPKPHTVKKMANARSR